MILYAPVLRWKKGEQDALHFLSSEVKSKITPIIEFPLNSEINSERLEKFVDSACKCIGNETPFYIDFSNVKINDNSDNALLLKLFRDAHEKLLKFKPILNTHTTSNIINTILKAKNDGCFDSVAFKMFENTDDNSMKAFINNLLSQLHMNKRETDLIVDLGAIANNNSTSKERTLNTIIRNIGQDFSTTIIIGGAIPQNNDFVDTDSSASIERFDWLFWRKIHSQESLNRICFGDFTTTPYKLVDIHYRGAPKIKYTLDDKWFVLKGHRPRSADTQRRTQSGIILSQPFYRGENYSFGDLRIYQCANGIWGPGNSTNWVTNDINQHITFVVYQMSSILAEI